MPYELLENGTIIHRGGAYDPENKLYYLGEPTVLRAGERDFELAIRWLSDEDAERARAVLTEYRRSQAQAS